MCLFSLAVFALRKHAYLNMFTMSPPKNSRFSDKNSAMFHISPQIIDCGYSLEPPRRGGSYEYPQSIFCNRTSESILLYLM